MRKRFAWVLLAACHRPSMTVPDASPAVTEKADAQPAQPTLEERARAILADYDRLYDARDVEGLTSLYAPTVHFYGATLSRDACKKKFAQLASTMKGTQRSTVSTIEASAGGVRVTFGKDVESPSGKSHYRGYLHLTATGAALLIDEESDMTTDANLARLSGGVVREEADVPVDGTVERWSLLWTKPPEPDCVPGNPTADGWQSCDCYQFAFGERGDLDLVRVAPGAPPDRLALTPLFPETMSGAVLQRWAPTSADDKAPPTLAELAKRRPVSVMQLADYDHDGRATEFALLIDRAPACSSSSWIVVGISRSDPKLHAFASVEDPKTPLTLSSLEDWKRIAASPSVHVALKACGTRFSDPTDHGLDVRADGRLHAKAADRPCPP